MTEGIHHVLSRVARNASTAAHVVPRLCEVLRNRITHRSDHARWDDSGNLLDWWEPRTQQLAALIPLASRVIEFGAGTCRLPKYLDAGSTYIGSDIVARESVSIVCDLNERPFPDLAHLRLDVAVFAGVLEYIVDVPAVARWLATQVHTVVLSYDALDSREWTPQRLWERGRRKYFGYMNDYEQPAFVKVFEASGFRCVRADRWQSQELYLFTRTDAASAASLPRA
jgi:hypothetical protein